MDLLVYLRAIRRNWWVILLVTLIGVGISVLTIVTTTPKYVATLSFFVNTTQGSNSNLLSGDQYAQQRVASYVILITQDRMAKLVLADTHVGMSAGQIGDEISANAETGTVILTAQIEDPSPQRALTLATSLSTQFVKLVKIIDPAVQLELSSGPALNSTPVTPRKSLDLGLGLLVGLTIGIAAAVLRERFSKGARTTDDLTNLSGLPVLGEILLDRGAKSHPLIIGDSRGSARNESYRKLRTALQFVDVDSTVRVILVTSAVAGEGKSTTCANLAAAFAENGQRVLLIEADLRRPKVADLFGFEREVGLSNVLAGQVALEEALQGWGDSALTVLPSGMVPPNPSELLGSAHMAKLVSKTREMFDVVVIDSPPLLPVTDAAVTSANADGVVLVVRAAKTSKNQVDKALESLKAVDARVFGAVLNMTPVRRRDRKQLYEGYR